MKLLSNRSGKLYHVQSDYDCFVPNPISKIEIRFDDELINLLSNANKVLAELNIISQYLPNRDVFLAMYVQKESVVSSQIEGTQASLSDVLQEKKELRQDIEEIVNYVHALNNGMLLLEKLPLSIRYLKELHKILLNGVRGENKDPGELRHSQNWIGSSGCSIKTASFIPPCVDKMRECLIDLEDDINSLDKLDPLIMVALVHYQFETIHPFLDGNGRLGRLFIPLFLIEKKVISDPVLYLSLYFKQNRNEYYSLLMDVRMKGKYEEWIKFFLTGIIKVSEDSINTIKKLQLLDKNIVDRIVELKTRNKELLLKSLQYIYAHPYFKSSDLVKNMKITKPTANVIINTFIKLNIISSIDTKQRNSTYRFNEYVDILEDSTEII